jgi:hypothetical protein
MNKIIAKSICAVSLLFSYAALASAADGNPIYKELVNQGLTLANGKTIKLPEPVMADGLTAAAQQAVLKQVGPQNKPALMQQFLRGKTNDWYEDKQSSETAAQPAGSTGRRIDLYFVAQGKLETVASEGFVKKQIQQGKANQQAGAAWGAKAGSEDKDGEEKDDADKKDAKKEPPKAESGKVEFYTPEELKAHKLEQKDDENFKERYAHGVVNLLDKVQVTGTGYGVETRTPESLTIAFKIDRRFDKDAKYPNQYQLIKAIGPPLALGDPKPYSGFIAYAKITKLQDSEDKIFVEYHLLYDEPYEWFNGTTELISKLDTSYKENISKFRRSIREFQLDNPPPVKAPTDKSAEKK